MPTVGICGWFKRNSASAYDNVDLEVGYIQDNFDEDSTTTGASIISNNNNNNRRDICFGYRCMPCTRNLICFGSLKWFLIVVCVLIMAQGSSQVYFNRTAHLWKQEYGFSEEMTDWLIVGNALFHAVFTIFIIHASIKYHRMVWISASLTLFVITCFALLIPEYICPINIDEKTFKKHLQSQQLCSLTNNTNTTEIASSQFSNQTYWTPFVLMVFYQATLGASSILLFIQGMVYIDDHESVDEAVLLNGVLMACKQCSPYLGNALTWLSMILQGTHIFATFEWIGLTTIILILAGFIGMFPIFLDENTMIKNAVCSADSMHNKKDLLAILSRIICNKIVILNILCSLFYWSAITNFSQMENILTKSKFAFPDERLFLDQMDFQVAISLLTPVVIFIAILFTATIVSRFNLRAFNLALWNTILPAVLVIFFLVYVFLGCDVPDFLEGGPAAVEGFCKWNCDCGNTMFEPVCVQSLQRVFFSPCYAGCSERSFSDGNLMFTNCTCGSPLHLPFVAHPGLCTMSSCYPEWLSQDLVQLTISALSGTALVCHIIVTMYCVHFSERVYALAIHVIVMSVVGSGPIRAAYRTLADATCRYASPGSPCRLHDSVFLTRYLVTLTIVLLIVSAVSGLILAVAIRRQISCSPDFLMGRPQRRRKLRSNAQEELPMKPLVFLHQIRNNKMNLTMATIQEEGEDDMGVELRRLDKQLNRDLSADDSSDYDERTPFISETAL